MGSEMREEKFGMTSELSESPCVSFPPSQPWVLDLAPWVDLPDKCLSIFFKEQVSVIDSQLLVPSEMKHHGKGSRFVAFTFAVIEHVTKNNEGRRDLFWLTV